MTAAKPNHLRARRLLLEHLDVHPGRTVGTDLDPAEVGIVGDTAHAEGGDSYHLGKDQIRARAGRDRYSVDESARDQRGLDNYASALDIGYFKAKTARGTFDLYDFNAWLIGLCRNGDPDTRDLREVIYSLDGRTVRRWDRLGRRSSGDDSHTWHTHMAEHRDADGHRMVRLATRWLQHIGLIPEEDDVMNEAQEKRLDRALALLERVPAEVWNHTETDPLSTTEPQGTGRVGGWLRMMESRAQGRQREVLAAVIAAGKGDDQALEVISAKLDALPGLTVDELAAADRSDEDIASALVALLGGRAAGVGRLMADKA